MKNKFIAMEYFQKQVDYRNFWKKFTNKYECQKMFLLNKKHSLFRMELFSPNYIFTQLKKIGNWKCFLVIYGILVSGSKI